MKVIELRFNGAQHLVQTTVWNNTDHRAVAAHEYPGKVPKQEQVAALSVRPGTEIPNVHRVEETTVGMFGVANIVEYSLLVEIP